MEEEVADKEASQTSTVFLLRCKKGKMTNMYLTEANGELIGDKVKDHEELYDKTNNMFKNKARKDKIQDRFQFGRPT